MTYCVADSNPFSSTTNSSKALTAPTISPSSCSRQHLVDNHCRALLQGLPQHAPSTQQAPSLALFQRGCPCYPRHESHRPVTWSSTIIEHSRPTVRRERHERQAGPCFLGWWRLFNMSCREGGRRGIWQTETDPQQNQRSQPTQF